MYKQIERHFRRYLPTLKQQLSDVYARVVLVHDQPAAGQVSTFSRPAIAVDLQVMLINGLPNESIPIIKRVPLPVIGAGSESVSVAAVTEGALCLLGFAYGSPRHPIVKAVYPNSTILPGLKAGEFYQGDVAGTEQHKTTDSWFRNAVNAIHDKSPVRNITAINNNEDYKKSVLKVAGRYLLTIGSYTLKTLGTIRIMAGHTLSLAALENIEIQTKKDINTKAAKQKMVAPKVYIGSDTVDLVAQVKALAEQVSLLDDQIKLHTHPLDGAKTVAIVNPAWVGVKAEVDTIKTEVNGLIHS